jgi:stearoyl-CoA desaturase (delta-9 desaturase)
MSVIAPQPRPAHRSAGTGIALGAIHVGACAAFFPATFAWSAVLLAFALYYLTGGIGVCLGYHRLLTHRSLKLARPLEYLAATLGVLALQGGPVTWVATHRAHHAFSDTERDPHDSRRGFMWSHMEWLYRNNPARLSAGETRRYAADVYADPYYRFLEVSGPLWQFALALGLFAAGGWPWVVWGIFVRLVVTYHATWLVNSAAHLWGYRTYRAAGLDQSTNNWFVGLVAWGEGWHNNHHAFPFSARHGLRWFELDATWWAIEILRALRLAGEVKVPTPATLARRAVPRARKPAN